MSHPSGGALKPPLGTPKHLACFVGERPHLHQDEAVWFPKKNAQQVKVRDIPVLPPGRKEQLILHESPSVITDPPLTLETRTPEPYHRRMETCPTSEEMEPGCGLGFSGPKSRPPSLLIVCPKLQGTGQCRCWGRSRVRPGLVAPSPPGCCHTHTFRQLAGTGLLWLCLGASRSSCEGRVLPPSLAHVEAAVEGGPQTVSKRPTVLSIRVTK